MFPEDNPDEAAIAANSKTDHLYSAEFKNGAGRFFNVYASEDEPENTTIEYVQPSSSLNKVKLTVTFIRESNDIKEVTFKRFKYYKNDGWMEKGEPVVFRYFTFEKLISFLKLLTELDLSSYDQRRVALTSDNALTITADNAKKIKTLLMRPDGEQIVEEILKAGIITSQDLVNVGYRKAQLEVFRRLLFEAGYLEKYQREQELTESIPEKIWQHFFRSNEWIFGLGLDYRFLDILQNEAHLGKGDLTGADDPIGDSLLGSTNFTVLVELKRPDTPLFGSRKHRANTWKLSTELTDAVSQILEQKASWQIKSETNATKNFNDDGELITQRTVDPKAVLIIGSDLDTDESDRVSHQKLRTFELFRRDSRNLDILTYTELYERARFLVTHLEGKA